MPFVGQRVSAVICFLKFDDGVEHGFGNGRAAGNVDIDGTISSMPCIT
jgi:hypothetical protein